jgi:LPS-assembly lipoprotein
MIGRRGLLHLGGAGLATALSGCGFHPLYAPGASQSAAMQAVYVDIIPNRAGQLLRQALQQRLEGSDDGVAKRYTLGVQFSEAAETLGIQPDNSFTRLRDVGRANWALYPLGNPTAPLVKGNVRSVDGYNVIDEQYFYLDLSEEATQRRLAQALADQIVIGLGAYFGKHPDKA